MQTTLGIDTGAPDHDRLREHSADFTPLPVIAQGLDMLWDIGRDGTFDAERASMALDPAAGAGAFGKAIRAHRRWRNRLYTFGVELRKEEIAHAKDHYDELTIGDAIAHADDFGMFHLIMTNPPFHLWKEYVDAFLPRLKDGGALVLLGLCSWGARSAGGVALFAEHPPSVQARITGTIGFRGPGVNPKTGKKWGADTRDYCWWVWTKGAAEGAGWRSLNLPMLAPQHRRWKRRPGT